MARRGKKSRSQKRKKKKKKRAGGSSAPKQTAGGPSPSADDDANAEPTRADIVDLDAEVGEVGSKKLADRLVAEAMALADPENRIDDATSAQPSPDAEPAGSAADAIDASREASAAAADPDTPDAAQAELLAEPAPGVADGGDDPDIELGRTRAAPAEEGEVFDLDTDPVAPDDVDVFDLDLDHDVPAVEDAVTQATGLADPEPLVADGPPTPEPVEATSPPAEPTTGAGSRGVDAPSPSDAPPSTADVWDLSALVGTRSSGAPPIDLGPESTPEARARLLAETLAHAEMQEARYRVPTGRGRSARRKGMIALAVFAIAGLVAIAPPASIVPEPGPALTDSDHDRGIHMTLLLQGQQIAAYQAREDRLPGSLADVGAALPGVRYVRSSSRLYQLVAYTSDGEPVIYDSSAPAPAFREITPPWVGGGAR